MDRWREREREREEAMLGGFGGVGFVATWFLPWDEMVMYIYIALGLFRKAGSRIWEHGGGQKRRTISLR